MIGSVGLEPCSVRAFEVANENAITACLIRGRRGVRARMWLAASAARTLQLAVSAPRPALDHAVFCARS